MEKKNLLLIFMLTIGIGLFAQSYMDNLVLFYPFEDNYTDASGNGNDATLEGNDLTYATGVVGKAAVFGGNYDNGDTTCLFTPEAVFNPLVDGSCAFVAWVNIDATVAENRIIAQITSKNGTPYLGNNPSANISNFHNNSGEFRAYFGATATRAVIPTTEGVKGVWHHLVVTFCISETDTVLKMYVDGEFAISRDFAAEDRGVDPGDSVVVIGKHIVSQGQHFRGMMDEVAIFSDSLSADDVTDIYTNGIVVVENIDDIEYTNDISVYNTPDGEIKIIKNIANANGTLTISDLLGKAVYSKSLAGAPSQFYIDGLPAGYYILHTTGTNPYARKILVK